MASLLEVRNLTVGITKEKKILKAVDNISFSIDKGEIVGLAGESGCGKSMTALSIPNLLPQAAKIINGEIIFSNNFDSTTNLEEILSLTSMSEKDMRSVRGKKISVIFQDFRQSLNPLMKVGNQITEMLELNREQIKENREQKVKRKMDNKNAALEMLAVMGFTKPEKIFDAFPHQLSGGMCQRIITAIAAISQPQLLLADEPSSALDEESEERIFSFLLEMNRNYKTSILIISHDLSIIKNFCSRFIIMYAGKIIEEGSSEALLYPLHPYTKALIAAIPGKEKRGKNLINIPGKVPSIEDQLPGCPFAPRCHKAQHICRESFPPIYNYGKGEEGIQGNKHRRVYCFFPKTEGNCL